MNGGSFFWAAFALLLILEGLMPLIAPSAWRRMLMQLLQLRDGQIRTVAFCVVTAGLLLLFAVT